MSFNIVKNDKKRVIIVGGGFGGLKLANKLKKSGFQVVLVDKNNYHQFPPLIYHRPSTAARRITTMTALPSMGPTLLMMEVSSTLLPSIPI